MEQSDSTRPADKPQADKPINLRGTESPLPTRQEVTAAPAKSKVKKALSLQLTISLLIVVIGALYIFTSYLPWTSYVDLQPSIEGTRQAIADEKKRYEMSPTRITEEDIKYLERSLLWDYELQKQVNMQKELEIRSLRLEALNRLMFGVVIGNVIIGGIICLKKRKKCL